MNQQDKAKLIIILTFLVFLAIVIACTFEIKSQQLQIDLLKTCDINKICELCTNGKAFYINNV